MTIKNEKLDEKFESSFDVNASIEDPVDKGSNKRPADKTDGDKASKSLTKAQMISGMTHSAYKLSHPELTDKYREFFAMQGQNVDAAANRATIKAGGLKEDMDMVFEGADLSEEAKDKMTTIFEAAVSTAIITETARLEEEFEVRLEEEVAEAVGALSENIEKFLDHVAATWLEENKLQVETGLRADIAEAFMAGLKNLFVEHYVEVPEDKVDVVEALTTQVEELTTKLNESENRAIDAAKALEEATAASTKAAVLATVSEGLTDSQRDKLALLAEDLTVDDTFATKLTQIKEGLIDKKPVVSADKQLNEELDLVDDKKPAAGMDPLVAATLASLSKK